MRADRRAFLATGGGLVVAFALAPRAIAQASDGGGATAAGSRPQLPGSLRTHPMLDGWIRVDPDGAVTVFTGKAELGQGIKTALIQVAAEELVVEPHRVAIVTADTERTANEGYTSGSHSMQDSGTAIRHAAAQVRALLIGMAATRLAVAAERLRVEPGEVIAPDGRRIGYGELVAGDAPLHVAAAPQSALRDPNGYRVVGTSMKRVDIPAKVSGGAAYVQDLRFDGMVHGRIVRPPAAKATLVALDDAGVRKLPGVLQVVRDGRFLGVVAAREYQAVVAQRALAQATRWDVSAQLPNQEALFRTLRAAPSEDHVILDRSAAAPAAPATTLTATYQRPYQMHASIGPSCAVARFADGRMTVWTHSQGVYPLRRALAELLAMSPESVRCIHVEGSGCYGHNGADDVAGDAALLARALPGRAVRVQWMREDEHGHEPYGPPMIVDLRAALDARGMVVSWQHEVWSNTHSARPGGAGDLLAGSELATPFVATPPKPLPQPEGGGDRNAIPIYALPSARVVHHFLPDMPLRVSALRSLGAYMNVFAIESFVDELARAARADPVEFRLRHLVDARAQDVLRAAAERFGWAAWRARAGRGRGVAFARYKNLAAYCAIAVELEVDRDAGNVHIVRAVAAVDSGEAVNPDGIANQIEGGIVQSASWTLAEQVRFDAQRTTSLDWGGYPILRFPQVPDRVEVVVLARRGEPFLGTGEAAQGPAAAAIANAIADATGRRVRDLPFDPPRLRAALANGRSLAPQG